MDIDTAASRPAAALCAANDNTPVYSHHFVTADDEPDMAARRAFVLSIRDKADPVLAWPTFERLAHLGDATKVGALMRWRDLTDPVRPTAANDNAAPQEGAEVHDELRREIRPRAACFRAPALPCRLHRSIAIRA